MQFRGRGIPGCEPGIEITASGAESNSVRNIPQGLKPDDHFKAFMARLNSLVKESNVQAGIADASPRAKQAAEKLIFIDSLWLWSFAGAKAQLILLALSARLKSCPDTKPVRIEFFRSLFSPELILLVLWHN